MNKELLDAQSLGQSLYSGCGWNSEILLWALQTDLNKKVHNQDNGEDMREKKLDRLEVKIKNRNYVNCKTMQSNTASGYLALTAEREERLFLSCAPPQALQQPGQSLHSAPRRRYIHILTFLCTMSLSSHHSVQDLWHNLEKGRRNVAKGFSSYVLSWVHQL